MIQSYNFGPATGQNATVKELTENLWQRWDKNMTGRALIEFGDVPFNEAGLLKLNCDKASAHLKWEPNLDLNSCLDLVSGWYSYFYNTSNDTDKLTSDQLEAYIQIARSKKLNWVS